ncbi:hypothetical protein PF003_g617 [Phytophthora fragariae]|nr:hypothetical protein PF003_g617 [Phytophthora fragariae]
MPSWLLPPLQTFPGAELLCVPLICLLWSPLVEPLTAAQQFAPLGDSAEESRSWLPLSAACFVRPLPPALLVTAASRELSSLGCTALAVPHLPAEQPLDLPDDASLPGFRDPGALLQLLAGAHTWAPPRYSCRSPLQDGSLYSDQVKIEPVLCTLLLQILPTGTCVGRAPLSAMLNQKLRTPEPLAHTSTGSLTPRPICTRQCRDGTRYMYRYCTGYHMYRPPASSSSFSCLACCKLQPDIASFYKRHTDLFSGTCTWCRKYCTVGLHVIA